jgi:hypothetical protein
VESAAADFRVDPTELGMMAKFGAQAWEKLEEFFPSPVCELQMAEELPGTSVTLSGTPDLFCSDDQWAVVLDWKGGRRDADYEHQLRGYAALLMLGDDLIETVTATVVWLRDQEVESYTIHRSHLQPWVQTLARNLASTGEFRPGTNCEFCPRSHECPALVAMAKRDAAILGDLAAVESLTTSVNQMTPARMAELLGKARMVSRFTDTFVSTVRARVSAAGGELDCGDKTLRIVESERREIDTAKAWDVLQGHLPDGALAECLDVRMSAVEKAVAAAAPPRQGAAAKRALAAELESAGAVSTTIVRSLKEFRKKEDQ